MGKGIRNIGKCPNCNKKLEVGLIDYDEDSILAQIYCEKCGGLYEKEYFSTQGIQKKVNKNLVDIMNKIKIVSKMMEEIKIE